LEELTQEMLSDVRQSSAVEGLLVPSVGKLVGVDKVRAARIGCRVPVRHECVVWYIERKKDRGGDSNPLLESTVMVG
jgi:hypothetical protein